MTKTKTQDIPINRGAQNVASVVARWCLWRVQRGPSGPVEYCVICSWPLHFGFIVFLQRNPAIKLLCNDVDVVLVYLVDSVVLVCCCDKYIELCCAQFYQFNVSFSCLTISLASWRTGQI